MNNYKFRYAPINLTSQDVIREGTAAGWLKKLMGEEMEKLDKEVAFLKESLRKSGIEFKGDKTK